MKVSDYRQAKSQAVEMEGAVGCQVRWLVGANEGAPNFAMRQFEVAPGGHTPCHRHPYEHEVFILEGEGVALEGDQEHPLAEGHVVYVQPDELHQFRNTGNRPLKFLCLVPLTAASQQSAPDPTCGVRSTSE